MFVWWSAITMAPIHTVYVCPSKSNLGEHTVHKKLCVPSYRRQLDSGCGIVSGSGFVIESRNRKIASVRQSMEYILFHCTYSIFIHMTMSTQSSSCYFHFDYKMYILHITIHWISWSPLYQLPHRINVHSFIHFHSPLSYCNVLSRLWFYSLNACANSSNVIHQLFLTQKMWKVLR